MIVCLSVCKPFFSVKYFSATTGLRALKFGKKLQSGKLYCVTKNSHILLISPFICSFFFLSIPMKILTFFLSKISQQLLDLRF